MSSIRVTRGGDVFRLPCNDTDTLLALLRRAGCTLPAACGGHGRCGIIFSKERVKTHAKADEERERNLVPLEEALAVSDKKNLRMLMLNVIRGDLQDSLESIALALNSSDSETSHYAASVLRDELNDFRVNVQKIYTDMKEEKEEQTDAETMLIDYMKRILCQKVFTEIEQAKFVQMMVPL